MYDTRKIYIRNIIKIYVTYSYDSIPFYDSGKVYHFEHYRSNLKYQYNFGFSILFFLYLFFTNQCRRII